MLVRNKKFNLIKCSFSGVIFKILSLAEVKFFINMCLQNGAYLMFYLDHFSVKFNPFLSRAGSKSVFNFSWKSDIG